MTLPSSRPKMAIQLHIASVSGTILADLSKTTCNLLCRYNLLDGSAGVVPSGSSRTPYICRYDLPGLAQTR